MIKKIIAYILILSIVFSIVCFPVYADDNTSSVNSFWDFFIMTVMNSSDIISSAMSLIAK